VSKPKLQHYLPVCYLDGFSRNGKLWVFDRDKYEYRPQGTRNTAAEKHFYTLTGKDGDQDFVVERWLSEKVETHFPPLLRKLENAEPLTPYDKTRLGLFISVLKVRTPEFARNFTRMASDLMKLKLVYACRIPEIAQRFLKDAPESIKAEYNVENFAEFAQKHITVKPHSNERLRNMLRLALRHQKYIRSMDWIVYHSPPETSFVTTDAPFVIVPSPDHGGPFGLLTPNTLKIVPLSGRICLMMTEPGTAITHRDLTREQVREFNRVLACDCERFLIGRDEALVRSLVASTEIDAPRSPFRADTAAKFRT